MAENNWVTGVNKNSTYGNPCHHQDDTLQFSGSGTPVSKPFICNLNLGGGIDLNHRPFKGLLVVSSVKEYRVRDFPENHFCKSSKKVWSPPQSPSLDFVALQKSYPPVLTWIMKKPLHLQRRRARSWEKNPSKLVNFLEVGTGVDLPQLTDA